MNNSVKENVNNVNIASINYLMFLVITFYALYKFPLKRSPIWTFVVLSFTHVQLFETSWTAACQASLPFIISWSLVKLMSIESVIPSNHLILCSPFLLLPSIFPSIKVFSDESVLRIRWPKYWSFSFSISPSNEHPGLLK